MKRRKGYPRNSDIRSAIYKVFRDGLAWHPQDLCEAVLQELEAQGLETKFVTEKRIWRNYEWMVRKGWMRDWLEVVVNRKSRKK